MIDPDVLDINDPPVTATDRTLRQFGLIWLAVFGVFAGRALIVRGDLLWGTIFAVVALTVGITGLARPRTIGPLFALSLALTIPIGLVVSRVVLAVAYFGMFTPLALIFRMIGRDALSRRRRQAASYWTVKETPSDLRSYLRQS